MGILFLVTGIAGNIFATAISDPLVPSVGASTAIFGIFGGMIGFIILNYKKLPPNVTKMLMCVVGFIIIMNFLLNGGGVGDTPTAHKAHKKPSEDAIAHLGGLVAGIFFGMIMCELKIPLPISDTVYEKRVKLIGILGFTVY